MPVLVEVHLAERRDPEADLGEGDEERERTGHAANGDQPDQERACERQEDQDRGEPVRHFTHTKTKARMVTLPAIASAYVRTRPVWSSRHLGTDPARAGGDRVDRAEQDRPLDPVTERDGQSDARPVEDPVVELVEVELVLEDRTRPAARDGIRSVRAE